MRATTEAVVKSCNMSEAPGEILELVERVDRTRALLEAVVGAATALPESEELRAATVSIEAELARLEDALARVKTGIVAAAAGSITAPTRRRGGSVCGR